MAVWNHPALGLESKPKHDRPTALKTWFAPLNGAEVATIQLTANEDLTALIRSWQPGSRTVNTAKRAGGVFLGESFREYSGVTALQSGPSHWVGLDKSMSTFIIYTTGA